MKSFLCRVMTFVFLLNCLTPTTGWGQTTRRSNARSGSLDKHVAAQVQKAQEANTPATRFARADQEARTAHNERFAQADEAARKAQQEAAQQAKEQADLNREKALQLAARDALVQQPASLRVARPLDPKHKMESGPSRTNAKLFLKKVANNEIPFEELIDYADPMDPAVNDLLTITYAAEVINNTVGQAIQLDPSLYDKEELQAQLVKMQARLLYRLALLGFEMPSYTASNTKEPVSLSRQALTEVPASTQKTMAVASLRMALLKIHQFYQAKQLPDPADEYQKEMLVRQAQPMPKTVTRVVEMPLSANKSPVQSQAQVRQNAAKAVQNHGNIASFMKQFVSEFKQTMAQEPKEGSGLYHQAQVKAEYATAYALEYNPAYLKQIVAAVDPGPKKTDFKQDYAPILNAIFVTVFENTRYSTMGAAKTKQVLNSLQEFSDPQKYSLPTQVFALEAASLLFRPFNQDAFNRPQREAIFAPVNFNLPDENLRRVFAQRVANLYCPLVSQNSRSMKDYGLASEEMEALADKLGDMYDGFYDIRTPFFEDASKPASQHVRANYPQTQCNITTHGNLNKLKKSNEQTAAFLYFSAEVLFWVYGGELFSLLGTAFRLTRGAVAALPKAGRAFTTAARGEKVAAFNAKIQEGVKLANWVRQNTQQEGRVIELLVEEKVPNTVTEVGGKGIETAAEVTSKEKVITTTHALQGKNSAWWMGLRSSPNRTVTGMRIIEQRPGLNNVVYEARWDAQTAKELFGTPHLKGLNSWQDVETAMAQLRNVADGTPFHYTTRPFWEGKMFTNQVLMERSLAEALYGSLEKATDTWIPLIKKADATMARISSKSAAQAAAKEEIRWWNLSWGKAPKGHDISQYTDVFIAPRGKWNVIENAARLQAEGGLLNAPSQIPGFFTSALETAQGKLGQQTFDAFFRSMNWQSRGIRAVTTAQQAGANANRGWQYYKNLAKHTFLPDYIPTKMFWQFVKESPTVFGTRMLPKLLWRNRIASTTAFFGAMIGADYLVYPPFKAWIDGQAEKDYRQEMNKYGDTFSEHQAKMDELLLKDLGAADMTAREVTALSAVQDAQPEEKDGTLVVASILAARRALGMEFVDDASKAMLETQAAKTNVNRALLRKQYNQKKQIEAQNRQIEARNKQIEAQNQAVIKQWRQNLTQEEQQFLAAYPFGFAAVPGASKKVHQAYAKYMDQLLAAQTDEQVQKAKNEINQALQTVYKEVVYPNTLAEGENFITKLRQAYEAIPGFLTPEAETQIRALYKNYAQELRQIDTTKPAARAEMLLLQGELSMDLAGIQDQIEKDFYAKHPEYQAPQTQTLPEYGAEFDPNAAAE